MVLALLSRKKQRPVFYLVLLGAACMILTQVAWWTFVLPVNNEMVIWTPEVLPSNFADLRNQWEYTHAARAVLQIIGLGAIVASVLVEKTD